ncbi:MAG: amidohydrolase family protein [Candidatus Rokubacteria bacterium]|nr:amidohydrolase family protein [Candidatus Rokubacteria bacterium]
MTDARRRRVFRGGRVLSLPEHRGEAADVLLEGDAIRAVGPPGLAAPPDAEVIDARDRLLLPGLVNAHTHAHGALGKGLAGDRWSLELLLNANPTITAERTREDKRLCAMLSAVEMVRKGSTACFDLFVEFPIPTADGVLAVAEGYREVGIRAVVAPMISDRTLYEAIPGLLDAFPEGERERLRRMQAAPTETSLAVCAEVLRRWPFDRARLRPGLGPTIPLHCSDALLTGCRDLAREWGAPLQTHLAESRVQALAGRAQYDRSLTAHLDALGLLAPGFSAAHAIWIDADDIRRLADRGAAVAHNPLSNLRFGSGIAPVHALHAAGVPMAIGTDGANTSDSQSVFECLRLAAYLSRVRSADRREWLSADDVFQMATGGGAVLLGLPQLGRIAPGHGADLVALDLRHVSYVPLRDIPLQVVNGESGLAIDGVMIAGQWVLRDGRMVTVDEDRLRSQVAEAVERLAAVTHDRRELARGLEPYLNAFCLSQSQRPLQM